MREGYVLLVRGEEAPGVYVILIFLTRSLHKHINIFTGRDKRDLRKLYIHEILSTSKLNMFKVHYVQKFFYTHTLPAPPTGHHPSTYLCPYLFPSMHKIILN